MAATNICFSVFIIAAMLGVISCSPLLEKVKMLNEQGLERRDIAAGSCISHLYVMAFTSGHSAAGASDTSHQIELKVNGAIRYGRLPNIPGSEFERYEGDLWKLNVPSFGFLDLCIRKSEIENIAIKEGSNDAWKIDSIVTFVGTANGQFELASMDIDCSQWINRDTNPEGELTQRFDLTLLLN
jgi:hypothetical protein